MDEVEQYRRGLSRCPDRERHPGQLDAFRRVLIGKSVMETNIIHVARNWTLLAAEESRHV